MHIPDGYLSPSTCVVLYATSAPFWYVASRKVSKVVSARLVPLISIFAAFSFLIMMFNVPLPGGTSGHAVGATLVTIALGPWAAILAVSVALAIQALFFGDGGILAFGANSFNMAIVMPLVAAGVYRLIAGRSAEGNRRRVVAAAVAGYVAINAAAFVAAVEFGIQPLLFQASDGAPLYSPYGLSVAIPAMMIGHLLIAGPVEAIVTALAVAYILRTNPGLLQIATAAKPVQHIRPRLRWLWGAIAALVVLTPLGLFATGTAWGEWNPTDPADWPLPAVPQGLVSLSGIWSAPLPDYAVPFLGEGSATETVGYVLSAVVGVALLALIGLAIGKLLSRRGAAEAASDEHEARSPGVD